MLLKCLFTNFFLLYMIKIKKKFKNGAKNLDKTLKYSEIGEIKKKCFVLQIFFLSYLF